jgi:hypothetical protein
MLHSVGEAPHLRVAALAGVASDGVGQLRYLPEGFEDLVADQDLARGATLRVGAALPELADLTEGTAQRAGLDSLCRIVHSPCVLSSLGHSYEGSVRPSADERVGQVAVVLYVKWRIFGGEHGPVAWREDY